MSEVMDSIPGPLVVQDNINLSDLSANTSLYDSAVPAGFPPPPAPSETEARLLDLIYVLDRFGVPFILAVGIMSNIILAVTIRITELKKVSVCCYFFSLAIVDTLYLIAMAIPWASTRLVDIYNREGFCQLVLYLNLLTTFLSSWYIVMMLFERMIQSVSPEKARKVCNAFRTKCYVTVLSVFSIVGHLYLTWTSGVYHIGRRQVCTIIPENTRDILVLRKVDIVFSFILPVTLALGLTVGLICYTCGFYLQCRDELFTMSTERVTFEVRIHTPRLRKNTDGDAVNSTSSKIQRTRLLELTKSKRLTAVSLILSIVYIGLSLPHNVIKSRITFMNGASVFTNQDRLFLTVFEELYKVNFAYKGIIYFCLIPEMRMNLMKLCFACGNVLKRSRNKSPSVVSQL